MIRILLVMVLSALGVASPFAPVAAQDKKEPSPKEEPGPSLKVGDPAPALKVTRWLQGEAVQKFEPGKAYVVHFWAPWCGNCVNYMPRWAEYQAQYKNRGLTVIGVSVVDSNNSEENVAAFVKKRGPSKAPRPENVRSGCHCMRVVPCKKGGSHVQQGPNLGGQR